MGVPMLICYTVDYALDILKEHRISNVSIVHSGACFRQKNDERPKRVIGQRNKNGLIELIVC